MANADTVRASKLRRKVKDGVKLSEADRIWLADYDKNAKRPGRPSALFKREDGTVGIRDPKLDKNRKSPVVSGPQLAITGTDAPTGGHVHETVPDTSGFVAADMTWIPEVPPEAEHAEPPPDGAPPPPKAGTPLVDDESSTGQGDPEAAKQFAALVRFLCMMGLRAGHELVGSVEMPDDVKAFLSSPQLAEETLTTVGEAAERLAIKYGIKSVPLGDEAIVVGAVLGSGVLVVKNAQRKKKLAKSASPSAPSPGFDVNEQQQRVVVEDDTGLWKGSKQ